MEETPYIDIHSHLNLSPLFEERNSIVEEMKQKNVKTITVGTDLETSHRAIELCKNFPEVCLGATIGQHPNDNKEELFDIDTYTLLSKEKEVVGIGECGFDFFRLTGTNEEQEKEKERQEILFRYHIELAHKSQKMIMIHSRPSKGTMDAYEKTLDILEEYIHNKGYVLRGDFHFFVGNVSIAERILKISFLMSFDGPITFTNEYDEVIRYIPLEMICAETDAPFAAPAPHRGQVCKPWMVEEVYKKIAEIKNLPLQEVKRQIYKNFEVLFKNKT